MDLNTDCIPIFLSIGNGFPGGLNENPACVIIQNGGFPDRQIQRGAEKDLRDEQSNGRISKNTRRGIGLELIPFSTGLQDCHIENPCSCNEYLICGIIVECSSDGI